MLSTILTYRKCTICDSYFLASMMKYCSFNSDLSLMLSKLSSYYNKEKPFCVFSIIQGKCISLSKYLLTYIVWDKTKNNSLKLKGL